MRRSVLAIVGSQSCEFKPKPLKRSASIDIIRVTRRDRYGGEQTALKKQRVSLRGVYVWGINLTVTKHSDYFVWKDASERVTRRCDDTTWQEASEFLCMKTSLFLSEFRNNKIPKKTLQCPLHEVLRMSRFQKFEAGAGKKKPRGFYAVLMDPFINPLIRGQRFWEVVCFSTAPLTCCSWQEHLWPCLALKNAVSRPVDSDSHSDRSRPASPLIFSRRPQVAARSPTRALMPTATGTSKLRSVMTKAIRSQYESSCAT